MHNKSKVEEIIIALGASGKRITESGILERIVYVEHKTVELCGVKMMFCGIALKTEDPKRPFVVVGEPSIVIDDANWRKEIGEQVSFDNSFNEIWKLEAYRFFNTPKPQPAPNKLGFHQYESKPVTRTAYQLTKRDLVTLTWDMDSNKATAQIEGELIKFAFHCRPDEIKAGDYVVFLNENDTYHCSEEVFNERNIT